MARRTTQTRTTRTLRSGGGGSAAGYILPALVVGGLAYLLWPRIASAFVPPKPVKPPVEPVIPITPVDPINPPVNPPGAVAIPPVGPSGVPTLFTVQADDDPAGAWIRSSPSENGRILGTIPNSTTVSAPDFRAAQNNYIGVIVSGTNQRGWIHSQYLKNPRAGAQGFLPQGFGARPPGAFTPLMRPAFGFGA